MGHVLQPGPPQGLVPGGSLGLGVISALTSRSRKFLGRLNEISGGSGITSLSLSD